MAFSSVPLNSEEGRAFFQRRLALFGKSAFFLFAGIAVMTITVLSLTVGNPLSHMRGPPFHMFAIFGLGLGWLACRRGKRSPRTLVLLDGAILFVAGVGIALIINVGKPEVRPGVPATLALTHLLMAHAIVVPSEWRRTFIVSTIAAVPTIVALLVLGADGSGISQAMAEVPAVTPLLVSWCLVAVAVATWTSHVIYRLQRRVAEATILGQYTLEEKIGEGGMGVVYRARHAMLRRPTVVKLLPPEKAGNANLVRFEREVQLTSLLGSANTVAVFDYGRTPDGIFYYAMEHLDGIDLDKLIGETGPLPAARVIHVLEQVCSALAEAHDAGLIHRDIKPGNVMLCRHGGAFDHVKVLDFGLVKDISDGAATKLTHADMLLGTPLYLSPEAMSDPEHVDGRSDLYAVGAMGYLLLTGRNVFEGRTVAELCSHHMHTIPVPPSQKRPGVPADLEALILACLEKSQDDRPKDARTLREKLRACADAGGWTEEDARAWWRDRGQDVSLRKEVLS